MRDTTAAVGVPHFVTGKYTSHRKFLGDKEYGEALDSIVKGCTDLLVTSADGTRVLLGKRCVHPQPDHWFIGGRMIPGDSPASSCHRILKRELGLEVSSERIAFVCAASLAWDMRVQEPATNGTADVQLVLTTQLTEEETGRVKLDAKEYTSSDWFDIDAVVAGSYHPALRHACRELLARRVEAKLYDAVDAHESDAALAALARQLAGLRQAQTAGTSAYVVRSTELNYEGAVEVTP
jgi:ADP-ribose pyrophosphatase YjhB (NUDIX family)